MIFSVFLQRARREATEARCIYSEPIRAAALMLAALRRSVNANHEKWVHGEGWLVSLIKPKVGNLIREMKKSSLYLHTFRDRLVMCEIDSFIFTMPLKKCRIRKCYRRRYRALFTLNLDTWSIEDIFQIQTSWPLIRVVKGIPVERENRTLTYKYSNYRLSLQSSFGS